MRIWKLVIWTTGEQYDTKEFYIDEPKFRQYLKAIAEDKDFIIMEDRVIKRTMIKEIMPADGEIREYLEQGSTLKSLGLPENPLLEEAYHNKTIHQIDGFRQIKEDINKTKK